MADDDVDYNQVGDNYKGVFYNEDEEPCRYFEYGAHFRYEELYRRLEYLKSGDKVNNTIKNELSRGKYEETLAPQSHININLNNIYINSDTSKSRNLVGQNNMIHSKSRNIQIPNNHSFQVQINNALKNLTSNDQITLNKTINKEVKSNHNLYKNQATSITTGSEFKISKSANKIENKKKNTNNNTKDTAKNTDPVKITNVKNSNNTKYILSQTNKYETSEIITENDVFNNISNVNDKSKLNNDPAKAKNLKNVDSLPSSQISINKSKPKTLNNVKYDQIQM